ncbi:MAG TPA: EAL domain-containing protein [Rhodocyclaceae bacterium]|nr:EAL domain-containing protein [Rhodocyclaceae bacterium]
MNAPLPANLMLVEDERIVAFDLKSQLQSLGYKVGAMVASGEQALEAVAVDPPDLVLMDIHLEGGIDGIDAALKIQGDHQIPVIFLTAYAEDESLRRALQSRPFGYLIKPCEARELHAMIQMALARRQVEVAVERSEQRLKLALDAASLGVLEWTPASGRLHADGHLNVLYRDRRMPVDEDWEEFIERVTPEDRQRVGDALQETLQAGHSAPIAFRAANAAGELRDFEAHAKAYPGPGGARRVVGIVQDVTQRRADDARLRQSAAVFRTMGEAIVITDAEGRIVAINEAFSRITGYSEYQALGADPDHLLRVRREAGEIAPLVAASADGCWQGEALCHRLGGEPFPTWQNLSAVRNAEGAISQYVIAFSDVTEIHQAAQKLDHLAHHDPLTGLPNRLLFDDRFAHAIDQAQRQQERCLLLFLDLDSFKVVNDTMGHSVGDELLRVVSERLKGVLRQSDTVARLGGDEFVILASSAHPDYAIYVAQKVLNTLRKPISLAGEEVTVSGSIGISLFPDHGADRHLLMRAADIAMYEAKAQGRNRYHFYSEDMSAHSHDRMRLEQGLRRAMDNDGLTVDYQPQVGLADGRIVGVEALVRWQGGEEGTILPARFIPVAEESGVIDNLGRWVLSRACSQIAGLTDEQGRQLHLAVNVSPRQFTRDDFVNTVRDVLQQTRFPADALELEITESTLQTVERSRAILNELKRLGLSISIDDFGTGYSSLSVLRDLPIDRVKIDRSFIVELPHQPDGVAIVEAMVALGRALNMSIVVEGIERVDQAQILHRLGCAIGQGFLFSRPLAYRDLLDRLRRTSDWRPDKAF